jgi:RNA polymerase sigma factor (sigma-70 family)
MMDRDECETTFLANLEWMRQAMGTVCRRRGMLGADAEDFVSWATCKLLEDDYAVLRQFRGESSVRTYLSVVIVTLHRSYRAQYWGRWRPSAAARREGALGTRLETLLYRDGCAFREAVEILRTSSGGARLDERRLAALSRSLPARAVRRTGEGAQALEELPGEETSDGGVLSAETEAECGAMNAALDAALATLPAVDRLVVRLRFWEGLTVADIARALGLPQKPLYRRLERALRALRRTLESSGLSSTEVRGYLYDAA